MQRLISPEPQAVEEDFEDEFLAEAERKFLAHENYVRNREYFQRPEVRAKKREYSQRPEVRAKKREYFQRPEVRAKQREYSQRPEVRAKKRGRDQQRREQRALDLIEQGVPDYANPYLVKKEPKDYSRSCCGQTFPGIRTYRKHRQEVHAY